MWRILRPLFFLVDAERVHYLAMNALTLLFAFGPIRRLARRLLAVDDPALQQELLGLRFDRPVGLAAGFDKNAKWYEELLALGFGSIEVGTFTGQAQPGNPTPRLFRLPADEALLNRFGFNNDGAAAAAARLAARPPTGIVGANLGKSKVVPNEDALSDYLVGLDAVEPYAAYLVVNVSSPNTAGLRDLQEESALRALLSGVLDRSRALAEAAGRAPRPIFVKIAPDLTPDAIDGIVDLALELGLHGIIATNTTLSREGLTTPAEKVAQLGAGGISGRPLTERSRDVVRRVYARARGRLVVIGAGGVFTADDAWEMIRAGASLVQVYTGFIYGGPFVIAHMHKGLADRLRARGLTSLSQVVGEAAGLNPEGAGPNPEGAAPLPGPDDATVRASA